jgi:hypothetical protein
MELELSVSEAKALVTLWHELVSPDGPALTGKALDLVSELEELVVTLEARVFDHYHSLEEAQASCPARGLGTCSME